jgi:hypothetical protein
VEQAQIQMLHLETIHCFHRLLRLVVAAAVNMLVEQGGGVEVEVDGVTRHKPAVLELKVRQEVVLDHNILVVVAEELLEQVLHLQPLRQETEALEQRGTMVRLFNLVAVVRVEERLEELAVLAVETEELRLLLMLLLEH